MTWCFQWRIEVYLKGSKEELGILTAHPTIQQLRIPKNTNDENAILHHSRINNYVLERLSKCPLQTAESSHHVQKEFLLQVIFNVIMVSTTLQYMHLFVSIFFHLRGLTQQTS